VTRWHAPGRINLIGEHTDYNDGFVLPIAIAQSTTVSLRARPAPGFVLHAEELGRTVQFTIDTPPAEHFAEYVFGCLRVAREAGLVLPGLQIHVASAVPMGVGLSSSAALEVAVLRALDALLGPRLDALEIARLAQRAEIEFAGVRCGIMDQMASSLADTSNALFVDTRSLAHRTVPLPLHTEVLVIDSGVARSLANSGYNERRQQSEAAAAALGVPTLRDVPDVSALAALPEPLQRRARHVVSENARVLRAIAPGVDAAEFGRLMNESHQSLRDDYEVSTPELDRLVALLQDEPLVHGARLTGAGFGGACVALCRTGTRDAVAARVRTPYAGRGQRGRKNVPDHSAVQ
jgi:galactokinase